MSTVTCHTKTCPNYMRARTMLLTSTVVHADGTAEEIWESGVYCSCMHRLRDIQYGPESQVPVAAPVGVS